MKRSVNLYLVLFWFIYCIILSYLSYMSSQFFFFPPIQMICTVHQSLKSTLHHIVNLLCTEIQHQLIYASQCLSSSHLQYQSMTDLKLLANRPKVLPHISATAAIKINRSKSIQPTLLTDVHFRPQSHVIKCKWTLINYRSHRQGGQHNDDYINPSISITLYYC